MKNLLLPLLIFCLISCKDSKEQPTNYNVAILGTWIIVEAIDCESEYLFYEGVRLIFTENLIRIEMDMETEVSSASESYNVEGEIIQLCTNGFLGCQNWFQITYIDDNNLELTSLLSSCKLKLER